MLSGELTVLIIFGVIAGIIIWIGVILLIIRGLKRANERFWNRLKQFRDKED